MEKRPRLFAPVSFSKEMKSLPKSIKMVSLVLFIYALGWGIVSPFIPIYYQSIFGSYTKVGLITAFLPLFAILMDIPIGSIVNTVSKRRFMQIALLLYIPFSYFFLTIRTLLSFTLFRFYHAFLATSLWISAESYTRYHSPPWKASLSISLYDAAGTLSLILGPLIGGILFSEFGFNIFYSVSIFAALALAVSLFMPDHDPNKGLKKAVTSLMHFQKFKDLLNEFVTNKPLVKVNIFLLFFRFCFSFLAMLLPLFLKDLGASYFKIGVVFSLFYLPLVFEPYFAMFANKKYTLKIGLFFSSILFFLLFANNQLPFVFIHSLLLALSFAAIIPILQGSITELMPKDKIGDLTGFGFVFADVSAALGPLMAGIVADLYGIKYVFLIGSIIMFILGLLVLTKVFNKAFFDKANIS